MEKEIIYLDYNATTPIDPEVAEAMKPFLGPLFGNPSSTHFYGTQARKAVERARLQIAELLNCTPQEIIFTSGGSESNNLAIKGAAYANRHKGNHIILSAVEHPAVTEVCQFLHKNGFDITVIGVDSFGLIDFTELEKSIRPTTILISVMHANNEVGTIQPVKEIGELARKHEILFHCDAAQSVGKIPVDVQKMHADLLSVAGHKFYGPKGVGALFIRQGVKLEKLIHGADHERNMRAGTENILEIVGLGKAAEIARYELEKYHSDTQQLRDYLYEQLKKELTDIHVNGHPSLRLPNTLNVSFAGVEASTLLAALPGLAASAGAACHSEHVTVSQVLQAMKVPAHLAIGTIRFSVGKNTTIQELDSATKMIVDAVSKLRRTDEADGALVDSPEADVYKLTQFTHGLGCACKLRPQVLEAVLKDLSILPMEGLLVGTETSDDAAVVQLNENQAIVQTLDFFTPIVDDPYTFGAIAAANALSDIYAMGAKPLFALNIVGFPSNRLPVSVLKDILLGAQDKAAEAGIPILGGHTVDDTEPKYGMVVSGIVHPQKVLTNCNLRDGDVLILTKKIGTGILSTALKRELLAPEDATEFIGSMARLNKYAAEIASGYDISACTDVTGFGLLGHLKEMTTGSGRNAIIHFSHVPVFEQVRQMISYQAIPGGTKDNLNFVKGWIDFDEQLDEDARLILADAQTSGGLLLAVNPAEAEDLLTELVSNGVPDACIIGQALGKADGRIRVTM